jgi:hypothetical protein
LFYSAEMAFHFVLYFCFILFSEVFILQVTSSLMSIFTLNSFISLFIVISVSIWCLFRAPMISFICFCVFHILYFCCLGISWVPPVHLGWPCLVTSPWNFH